MNSIHELKKIYDKYSDKMKRMFEEYVDSVKQYEGSINVQEMDALIFNHVLNDLNLSRYTDRRTFHIVEIDITPYDNEFYDEDARDVDDAEMGDETLCTEDIEQANLIFNKTLATDAWDNLMIYGGKGVYQQLLSNIIEEVKTINPTIAKKMSI